MVLIVILFMGKLNRSTESSPFNIFNYCDLRRANYDEDNDKFTLEEQQNLPIEPEQKLKEQRTVPSRQRKILSRRSH